MKRFLTFFLALYSACLFSSCGTIATLFNDGKHPILLMQAPRDIQAFIGKQQIPITTDAYFSYPGVYNTTVSYFTKSVRLPYKEDVELILYSPSLKKKDTIILKSKGSVLCAVFDIIYTAGIGLYIDVKNKNNRVLTPLYVDVESVLQDKPMDQWRKKRKLIKLERKAPRRIKHPK